MSRKLLFGVAMLGCLLLTVPAFAGKGGSGNGGSGQGFKHKSMNGAGDHYQLQPREQNRNQERYEKQLRQDENNADMTRERSEERTRVNERLEQQGSRTATE